MKLNDTKRILLDQCTTLAEVSDTWQDNTTQSFKISRDIKQNRYGVDEASAEFVAVKRLDNRGALIAEYILRVISHHQLTLMELPARIQDEVIASRVASNNQSTIIIATPKMLEDGIEEDDDASDEDFDVSSTKSYTLSDDGEIKTFSTEDIYTSLSGDEFERKAFFDVDHMSSPGVVSQLLLANNMADAHGAMLPDKTIDIDLLFGEFNAEHKEEWRFVGLPFKDHYRQLIAMSAFIRTGVIANGVFDSFIED
jgi:hypothetical protein